MMENEMEEISVEISAHAPDTTSADSVIASNIQAIQIVLVIFQKQEPTNQSSLFRSRDWLSANQGPVFPDLIGSRPGPFCTADLDLPGPDLPGSMTHYLRKIYRNPDLPEPRFTGTPIYRNPDLPEPRFTGTPIYRNPDLPEPRFTGTPIYRNPDLPEPRFTGTPIYRNPDLPEPRFTGTPIYRNPDLPEPRFTGTPIYRNPDLPEPRFTGTPIYRNPDLPELRFTGKNPFHEHPDRSRQTQKESCSESKISSQTS
eukprot:sb/3468570/